MAAETASDTCHGGATMQRDAENHLTSVGGLVSASYDAFGLRSYKAASSGSAYYLYDGTTPVVEMNYSGAVTAVCTYGPNGLLARWTALDGPVYYVYDPSGNVAQYLYASLGGYVNADYDAYGLNYTDEYGNPVPPPYGQPFGYQAQWGARSDGETGLVLMGWRYYDPAAGRFLTRDPIGYEGGINLYAYCQNNPVNLIDPLGLCGKGFNWLDKIQLGLDVAGLVPGFGEIADGANGLISLGRGDYAGAGLSFGAMIPFAGALATVAKFADKVDDVADTAKVANGAWSLGKHKTLGKWTNQLSQRGWDPDGITEAIKSGKKFPATNKVNKGNTATRYEHPETGRSVVVDDVTGEILQVGGDGFQW